MYRGWTSTRVPDLPRVLGRAPVIEGGVDHLRQVVARPPAEQELRLGVVEPGGPIRRLDRNAGEAARPVEVGAELAVVDGLVHADVERLAARRRVVERLADGVH